MMNGEAKQFLLKAAEDGEILPREGLFPALHHFMATRQETLSVQDKYQEPLQEDSKQPDCSPELPPTGGTFQQAGAGATSSPPGGRDTEGRQEVRWQIDAVWQLLGPGKAAPPASPAARRIFFGSFTPVRLWLPHTHRRGGRRKGAPLLGTAKNA